MNIKLEKFEGPLALLLQIIEKEELDITQVSLSKITDEYLNYIKNPNNNINPDEMADFLVIAAKLLLIKSKALLPYLQPEEKEEIDDLERQLKMYKEFIEATKRVEKMIGKKKFMFQREFNRQAILKNIHFFSPPKSLKLMDMQMIMSDVINRLRPAEKIEEGVVEHKISIEEKIAELQNMIINRIKFSFNHVLSEAKNKTEIIVSFLAMLELIKQRTIVVDQDELFSEITICSIDQQTYEY